MGKDELLTLVWPGLVVEDNNLTVQVSALRKLFGGNAIITVAGRGYQFVQPGLEIQEIAASAPLDGAALLPALLPALTAPDRERRKPYATPDRKSVV